MSTEGSTAGDAEYRVIIVENAYNGSAVGTEAALELGGIILGLIEYRKI